MNVTIQTMPAMRAAVVPHTGPYHEIGAAFARLGQLAGPAGLYAAAQGMIGIYLDDPALVPAGESLFGSLLRSSPA
ncbi:MAG: GyrI-like domain-containing protein [Gemmatimonadales bacterium]